MMRHTTDPPDQRPLQPGDIVRLRSGATPMMVAEIIDIDEDYREVKAFYKGVDIKYYFDGRKRGGPKTRCESDFVLLTSIGDKMHAGDSWTYARYRRQYLSLVNCRSRLFPDHPCNNDSETQSREENEMPTLYSWPQSDTEKAYGHKLAVNSEGHWVMETRASNPEVCLVDPTLVEKVMPYTVTLSHLKAETGVKKYYISFEGQVSVGDLILLKTGIIMHVDEVDSKIEAAERKLEGFRLQAEPLAAEKK